jgi:hypothetical protein
MGIEEEEASVMEAQAFPDAVAEGEAGVEDGDFGVGAREEGAVEIDKDGVVAGVWGGVLAASHGSSFGGGVTGAGAGVQGWGC